MMVARLARNEKIVEGPVPRHIFERHNATRSCLTSNTSRRDEELVAAKRQQSSVTVIQMFQSGVVLRTLAQLQMRAGTFLFTPPSIDWPCRTRQRKSLASAVPGVH